MKLVADCPQPGCGKVVGIIKPLPEPGAILRTAGHSKPDGTRCISVSIAAELIREGRSTRDVLGRVR